MVGGAFRFAVTSRIGDGIALEKDRGSGFQLRSGGPGIAEGKGHGGSSGGGGEELASVHG
jgi:hypothetical protein